MQNKEPHVHNKTVSKVPVCETFEIFDKLDMGVIGLDHSSHLTYSNTLAREILHMPEDEFEGRLLWDLLPATLARQLSEELDLARKDSAGVSFDSYYAEPHPLWIHFRCLPTREGVTVIFEDITEIKKAQESLKKANEELELRVQERTRNLQQASRRLEEQKELLLTIIDNIPVMLTFYDPTGTVRLVNREFERLAGWSLEEARSMNLVAAIFPDPGYRKVVWESMMNAKPGWKDLELTTRSGKLMHSSWANVRLSDGSLIGIGIDISARKRMEQDLQRLASAIEQADEGIMILNQQWEIDYVNPAYEKISGFQKQELINKPVYILESFFIDNTYQEIIRYVKKEGKAWSGHQKRKRASGELIEVNLTVSPVFGAQHEIINYVFLAKDITEEIRFQQQLLQVQKMEAIGNLAGGIAHNLKNAFTPILIDTEILMEDLGIHNPSYPILEEMLKATHQGIDLVRHLLTFSRRTPQRKKPIDIVPIVWEALNFLRASLPSTIEIRSRIDEDKAMTLADATQIKQVLINLGSNAGYSMEKQGGALEVDLGTETIDAQSALRVSPDLAPGSYIRIRVRDEGQGVDEQAIEHIFEPFFTTRGDGEGTGLGLSVVHGIIKEHNGTVAVESMAGEGTTFTVFLPKLKENTAD